MTDEEMMLTVEEFRKKYPSSSEEQVALYAAAVLAEQANPPKPEPDIPMPLVTVPQRPAAPPRVISTYQMPRQFFMRNFSLDDVPPLESAPDLTADIRRIVLGGRLTPAERAKAERPDMSGDDLLALLAGVPNAREFEALEGGD